MKQMYNNKLSNALATTTILFTSLCCANAQAPAGASYKTISNNQVSLPLDLTGPRAALNLSLAQPDSLSVAPGYRGSGPAGANVAEAGINGVRPFGSTPITIDAQVGFDPASSFAGAASISPINANEAWKALLGYQWGAFDIKAGVNQFYTNFTSPLPLSPFSGPQETLGGTEFDSSYSVAPNLLLQAGGQFYDGRSNIGDQSLLGANDHLDKANVGVTYGLSSQSKLALGYEWVQWDLNNSQGALNAPGRPTEQYITIGLGQNLSKNAAFKLLYQVEDYKDDGTGFTGANLPNNGGGTVIGQATIKF